MNSVFWMVIFAAAIGVGWLGVRWLTRKGAREYREEAEKLEGISTLSLHEASSRAALLLSDETLFRSIASLSESSMLNVLAPELRRVLERYESIEFLRGSGAVIARSSMRPSAIKSDFLQIGSVASGTDVEGEISVRPGEEAIYELYANEPPDPTFGTYRSIHHWVLAMAEEK